MTTASVGDIPHSCIDREYPRLQTRAVHLSVLGNWMALEIHNFEALLTDGTPCRCGELLQDLACMA